jgi:prepilin-type N-terminal cleavage/methylation domain-containing protein
MTRTGHSERGVTLIEATIVLAVVAILAAAAAPTTARALDRARLARAFSDEESIKTAITNFISDLDGAGFDGFTVNGVSNGTVVEMLVSDGDIPRETSATGGAGWAAPVDNTTGLVDFLARHLITNTPRGSSANDYPITGTHIWRGAYLNGPIGPDPWGNRYAVDTERLITTPRDIDVIVMSSGPDEEIDTPYEINGIEPGDDDIIIIIRRDPGLTTP